MENSLTSYQQKAKGLFDQKGGTLGMVMLALGVVAAIIFSTPLLALIQTALLHLWSILVLVAAISAVLYVAFDKNARMVVGTSYMLAIRWLMGRVIMMNPIAILEDTVKTMHGRIDDSEEKMGNMNGVNIKWKDRIKTKKSQADDIFKSITIFERKRDAATDPVEKQKWAGKVIVAQREANRIVEITKQYIELQKQAENWYTVLNKVSDAAKLTVEDAENELRNLKEKYELVKESHSAFKSMMSILKGDPDELANYYMASDIITKDITNKVGEMDRVLNQTGGMIDKMDTDKEIYSIKGNDLSKQYEEFGLDSLFKTMDVLPSAQVANKLMVNNITPDSSVIQKSASKYFNN